MNGNSPSSRQLSIVVLSHAYGPATTASGSCTWRLAEMLAASNLKITVVYSARFKPPVSNSGVVLRPCSPFPEKPMRLFIAMGNLMQRDICNLFWTFRAARACRDLQFDLIYGRGSPICSLIAAERVKRWSGAPLVQHFADPIPAPLDWQPDPRARRRLFRTVRPLCQAADGFSSVTPQMLQFQARQMEMPQMERGLVLPDPMPEWVRFGARAGSTGPVFLYLGSFYGNRRPEPLLKAFKRFSQANPAARLHIAGGRSCALIEPMLAGMGLVGKVVLLGQVDKPVLAMRDADILISIDGKDRDPVFLPAKLLEYLSTDRIVMGVTGLNSPTAEILNLVPQSSVLSSHDEVEMAAAMDRAARIPWTSASDQERRCGLNAFTAESIAPKAVAYLAEIAGRNPHSKSNQFKA